MRRSSAMMMAVAMMAASIGAGAAAEVAAVDARHLEPARRHRRRAAQPAQGSEGRAQVKALTVHQPFAWAIARIADCEFVTEAKGPTSTVQIRIGCKTTEAIVDGWRILGRYAWRLEDIRPLPWVPYAPGFLGFWKVEAWRLGACREVYEAAWSELEGRSQPCAS